MKIDVLTLFPGMFAPVLGESVIGRAVKSGVFDLRFTDIRDFSIDKHKKTDDYPYGGGHGMIMTAQPLYDAWHSVAFPANGTAKPDFSEAPDVLERRDVAGNAIPGTLPQTDAAPEEARTRRSQRPAARTIYMSPQGAKLTQKKAYELSREQHLIIVCGHYEGVDERALELIADEEISIGDYVLTGGEIPAMALIDCVARLIPGVLSDEAAESGESHLNGLLEYPQYTRPASFMGLDVPQVLLDGNHADIERWRTDSSIERTRIKRPDMLAANLRRIPIGMAVNLRDLGGFPASGGRATRWRTFLRSDLLEGFTENDKYALLSYGLTTVINLRSKAEAEKIPEPFGPEDGVDCYTIPLIPDAAINESIRSGPFKELYIRFAEHGIKKIGRVFTIMAQCHGTCLFHCYAGKDRTGIIAALLLLAMGVDRNDAIADYEISGTYYRRKIDDYDENDYDKSKVENIEYLLAHIYKKYGGAEGYLRAAGVGDADFEALRRKFLADPAI